MAFQNVSKPRFYINVIEWLDTLGMPTGVSTYGEYILSSGIDGVNNISMDIWRTLSASTKNTRIIIPYDPNKQFISFPIQQVSYDTVIGKKGFVAYLGHNFASIPGDFKIWAQCYIDQDGGEVSAYINNKDGIVNWGGTHFIPIEYDGFSISTGDYSAVTQMPSTEPNHGKILYQAPSGYYSYLQLNSIVVGSYYDMDAPNLSLTLSREYGGTKEFTSYNGSSFSNTFWSNPPSWGGYGSWELHDGSEESRALQSFSRSGRRVWQLSWSFMDDGKLWGSNQSLSFDEYINEISGVDTDDLENGAYKYNILTDPNFFSQVWHRTLGGTIPFIFQADSVDTDDLESGNNNPDQFAICRIRENSLKATQTAFNVYDISLTIEEVW